MFLPLPDRCVRIAVPRSDSPVFRTPTHYKMGSVGVSILDGEVADVKVTADVHDRRGSWCMPG
jgi:hypothetical protein